MRIELCQCYHKCRSIPELYLDQDLIRLMHLVLSLVWNRELYNDFPLLLTRETTQVLSVIQNGFRVMSQVLYSLGSQIGTQLRTQIRT